MKSAATLALAAALVVPTFAAAPPQGEPTFKAGVELVRLDVQVTNDAGRPIEDLRQNEVQVLENGRPRPVLFFQHVRQPSVSYVEAAARTIGGEISTNQGAPRGHLYVLVFDQDHITPGTEQKVRRAAEQFLKARLRPGDRVAVYGLPGPGPRIGFTSDLRLADAELQKVRGGLDRIGLASLGSINVDEAYEIMRGNDAVLERVAEGRSQAGTSSNILADVARPGIGEDPTTARQLVREDAQTVVANADQKTRLFLSSFATLIRNLRLVEGRKTILLFSEGFFGDHITSQLENVAAAAAQSYSVIYSFDLNNRSIDLSQSYGGRGNDQQMEIEDRISPLATLSIETDGRLFNDAGDWLTRSIDTVAAASGDYYLVGFEPSPNAQHDRDGYHPVTVRVSRPGAHVSTRTGYALEPMPTPADRRRAINAALSAPFPEQGLPIDYTTYELRGSSTDQTRVVLSASAELPLATKKDNTADVVFVTRSAEDGRVVASGTDTMALPTQARPGTTSGTGTYQVKFDAPPGDYLMRVIVREPGGLVGSADRRFSVRPLGGPGVTVSDLILGTPRVGHLPAQPRAWTNDVLDGFVQVYARTPQQLQGATVTFAMSPLGASGSGVTLTGRPLPVVNDPAGQERDVTFQLPLSGTAPGAYLVKATVRAGGETVGERERQVQILPGDAPVTREAAIEPAHAAVAARPAAAEPDPADVLQGDIARDYLQGLRNGVTVDSPLWRATAFALDGSWQKAEAALGRVDAGSAAALGLQGLAAMARHDFRGASSSLQAALKLDPRDARLAFLLGWADSGAGDAQQAIGDWRNAALLDPTLIPAHLALADAYVALGQPALAIQALQAGLRAVPDSPELRNKLTTIERQR
ncbi:MAG TPA: VWA domain-containing protein [Vicinamibacterales bacterium]|nr:VWA domain-containing protein [Vicinamibacterales bacterium]